MTMLRYGRHGFSGSMGSKWRFLLFGVLRESFSGGIIGIWSTHCIHD